MARQKNVKTRPITRKHSFSYKANKKTMQKPDNANMTEEANLQKIKPNN